MTEDEMKAQLEAAHDMLEGMQNQRNAAQNECVQLAATVKAAQRKIAELEAKVKELTPAEPEAPKANGHDGEAAHAAH